MAFGVARRSSYEGLLRNASGNSHGVRQKKKAPYERFRNFYRRKFPKAQRKVRFEWKVQIGGREREFFLTIWLQRRYQYDKGRKCWILFLLVEQMDFGAVNSCECCEDERSCRRCEGDKPFIHIVSTVVKPNLPEGTTVQNVVGTPFNHPQPVTITSGRNQSLQLPFKPQNASFTVQSSETVAVNREAFAFGPASLRYRGEAITWTWKLSRWENGRRLSFNDWLPSPERVLPVDPWHVQVHPQSSPGGGVTGEWHIEHARKPQLRHTTFDIDVEIHTALVKRTSVISRFNLKEATVLSDRRSNIRLR